MISNKLNRKLNAEVDRLLKKVTEGIDEFDDILKKVHAAVNPNQKEKYEAELKKEIKKLQRYRDQIKSWYTNNEVKNKAPLVEARRVIEARMELFKQCEKETKTKPYSKEALARTEEMTEEDKSRDETREWITNTLEQLNVQIDSFSAELDTIKKKKGDPRFQQLTKSIERHRLHIERLEKILRLLHNEKLTPEQISEIRDGLDYYVTNSQEPEFLEDETLYDSLGLQLFDLDQNDDSDDDDDSDGSLSDSDNEDKPPRSPKLPKSTPSTTTTTTTTTATSSSLNATSPSVAVNLTGSLPSSPLMQASNASSSPPRVGVPPLPTLASAAANVIHQQQQHNKAQQTQVQVNKQVSPKDQKDQTKQETKSTPASPLLVSTQPITTTAQSKKLQPITTTTVASTTGGQAEKQQPSAAQIVARSLTNAAQTSQTKTNQSSSSQLSSFPQQQTATTTTNTNSTTASSAVTKQASQIPSQSQTPPPQPLPTKSTANTTTTANQPQNTTKKLSVTKPETTITAQQQESKVATSTPQQTQTQQENKLATSAPSVLTQPPNTATTPPPSATTTNNTTTQQTTIPTIPIPVFAALAAVMQSTTSTANPSPATTTQTQQQQQQQQQQKQQNPPPTDYFLEKHAFLQHLQMQPTTAIQDPSKSTTAATTTTVRPSEETSQPQQAVTVTTTTPSTVKIGPTKRAPYVPAGMRPLVQSTAASSSSPPTNPQPYLPPQQTQITTITQQTLPTTTIPTTIVPQRSLPRAETIQQQQQHIQAQLLQQQQLLQSNANHSQAALLETSMAKMHQPGELERSRPCVPKHEMKTNPPSWFPTTPVSSLCSSARMEKMDADTLFFIFYYQQNSYQQYLAAQELKRQAWRYHKKYLTWFQRHDEPREITADSETGTYVYFDYETGWCQRMKADFTFEYRFLEE